jgi:hypothetical protein
MADDKNAKSAPAASGNMVSVYNKGPRLFLTSAGPLPAEGKLLLPKPEADALLKYPEIIETGKMSARDNRTVSMLKAENAQLRAERDALLGKKADKDEKAAGK